MTNAVHDEVHKVSTYDPEDPQSDAETEVTYVYPQRFRLYNFNADANVYYVDTSHGNLKEVHRRYRATTGDESATINIRRLDLRQLRHELEDVEEFEYSLQNVDAQRPYRLLRVRGPQIGENDEAQEFIDRARDIRWIVFILQRPSGDLNIRISDDGSITFLNYPDDATILDIFHALDPLIEECSGPESLNVRNRRRR